MLLAACGEGSVRVPAGKPSGKASATNEPIETEPEPSVSEEVDLLRADIADLTARAERSANQIEVQHLLVSFAGKAGNATRSRDDAESLAASLYSRIKAGEDFDALVKEFTNDSHPGIYKMSMRGGQSPGVFERTGMVPAFGNVGWRLNVGEVGVAPFHDKDSPYGWHIIKRLQ